MKRNLIISNLIVSSPVGAELGPAQPRLFWVLLVRFGSYQVLLGYPSCKAYLIRSYLSRMATFLFIVTFNSAPRICLTQNHRRILVRTHRNQKWPKNHKGPKIYNQEERKQKILQKESYQPI